ncbi:MAG: (E)-4-hydroxy-3-methylbut-2-enyl-diphosphate synthase [Chlamydiae bacterium]|nr:(E)-4-hydroxy-3-methylbut-2-enyl-diphosphate synthase [Chlamydiota bacterium]
MDYCNSVFASSRRKTREVKVGKVGVGGDNPVRIQSMTTSNTRDIEATIEQAIRLADAGCEIVRVTVQGIKEAESCEAIKNGLLQKGYDIPIVADIHFYPPAAMKVVEFVDKVRINPGNFLDKRALFKTIEYDEASYRSEIEKIREGFSPLVDKCKTFKKSLRIGTNHGSLSDRIMNRYGDTPAGMVESALEFARVARDLNFHDMIFSMKASNPKVMIHAYRLLVAEMNKLGWDYPLHLGVTESGEGEDGRIKSALGIGSLLLDGIGDTIRVSLTEDPWEEIDPCKRLVAWAKSYQGQSALITPIGGFSVSRKIHTKEPLHPQGTVLLTITEEDLLSENFFANIGCSFQFGSIKKGLQTPDMLLLDKKPETQKALENLSLLRKGGVALLSRDPECLCDVRLISEKQLVEPLSEQPYALEITESTDLNFIISKKPLFLLFTPENSPLHESRALYNKLCEGGVSTPFLLGFSYKSNSQDTIIHASSECGALLTDGIGEGLCLFADLPLKERVSLSFGIAQAARLRTVKTEFISCPGCGRTLFELQSVSKRIREKTAHLPGVKIAIMGCIVNGPGEMADADFGYVGSRPGKIDLYVGKQCVEKNIDFAEADERLIDLIKSHGRWVEKEVLNLFSPSAPKAD